MDNSAVRLRTVAVLLAASVLLPAAAAHAQCVMCGTVGQGGNDPLVKGMFRSIVFMVSMPFGVIGAVAGWFHHQYRQRRKAPSGEERT